MSILLDAVNRKKQQQGDVVDIMSTQPPQYTSQSNSSNKLNQYSLLAVAIALGIGAAWGMSVLLQSPSASLSTIQHNDANVLQTVTAPVAVVTPHKTPEALAVNKNESAVQNNDDIRLAGKVALPIAKPFNTNAMNTQAASYNNNGYAEPSGVNEPYLQANDGQRNFQQANSQQFNSQQFNSQQTNAQQANFQQPSYQQQAGYEQDNYQSGQDSSVDEYQTQESNRQQAQQREAIALGAKANRRGLAELEALRLQVNAAAEDVDFASVKAPSIKEQSNLIAAFETALKDVEYEQSANQQVTSAKLDPIPRPSNQQIPKYGDLPASVQLQVPEFNINAHVYSTEPSNRWLNVDGVELQQGDMIKNKLTIVEIRPRDIVLEIDGEQFRVPAI
ncbi:general secretion pathway protein GspB [Shewanella sp. AC34-MNA-CIBAN-0136]|uniref:general secretion pathway protein GspB n=1 Tax=Shewanella sp. AC34-MNA-CIBAN-0136 TaxID=3140463 RepID=UPI00331A65F4